tara:strand:- start:1726 stop:1890 length:165 start_codon:yes stop_codon:yes gene_type:complete
VKNAEKNNRWEYLNLEPLRPMVQFRFLPPSLTTKYDRTKKIIIRRHHKGGRMVL